MIFSVLVFVNEFVIFSFFAIFVFVFVNENYTVILWTLTSRYELDVVENNQLLPCSYGLFDIFNSFLEAQIIVATCCR